MDPIYLSQNIWGFPIECVGDRSVSIGPRCKVHLTPDGSALKSTSSWIIWFDYQGTFSRWQKLAFTVARVRGSEGPWGCESESGCGSTPRGYHLVGQSTRHLHHHLCITSASPSPPCHHRRAITDASQRRRTITYMSSSPTRRHHRRAITITAVPSPSPQCHHRRVAAPRCRHQYSSGYERERKRERGLMRQCRLAIFCRPSWWRQLATVLKHALALQLSLRRYRRLAPFDEDLDAFRLGLRMVW